MERVSQSSSRKRRPLEVAITGLGPVCAAGVGHDALWRGFQRPPGPAPLFDPASEGIPFPPYPLFRVDRAALDEALPAAPGEDDLPPDAELRLALAALRLALDDAGLPRSALSRAALVLTWEAPGADRLLRDLFGEFLRAAPAGAPPPEPADAFLGFYRRHRDAVYGTHSFLHLHVLARALGVHGPALFVNNACASGLYALDTAARLLQEDRADVALVAAAECPVFPTKKLWFQELGLYAEDGYQRPFDARRQGIVFGEAAAAAVLEPAGAASRRGRRPWGTYLGGHVNQEAWKVAVPNLADRFHEETIREACAEAGVALGEVDAVGAHGAGTVLSDLYEARGLTGAFGEWPQRPDITAFKPYFGHALGASALLELCSLLVCATRGSLVATPGFETPDERLKVAPVRAPCRREIRTVLKVANGFAGFNAASVIRVEHAPSGPGNEGS